MWEGGGREHRVMSGDTPCDPATCCRAITLRAGRERGVKAFSSE